jgi:SAM-dependent methyltransferase
MQQSEYKQASLPAKIPDDWTIIDVTNALRFGLNAQDFALRQTRVKDVHGRQIETFLSRLPEYPKILEIGCGVGRDIGALTAQGAQYYGIDSVLGMLQVAKDTNPFANLSLQNIFDLNYPDHMFDGIWCAAVLHHFPLDRLDLALKSVSRVLKINGSAFFSVREGDGLWQDPKTGIYYHRHSLASFANILKQNSFTVERAERELSRPDQAYLEYFVKRSS